MKVAAAACIVLVVLLAGIPFISRDDNASAFVLTAYASEDDKVISNILEEGNRVPVSMFETENGIKGFVFSYDMTEPEQVSSVSVMTEGEFPGIIEEIVGLDMETDQHYIYYVPEQSKSSPYRFMIPYTDEDTNTVYLCYLLVEESEGGYQAVIEKMEGFERKFKE